MMTKLEDLKMVLEAIQAVRGRWIRVLESRIAEIMHDSKKTYKEAFSAAISHEEVNKEFQSLITLYGVVGSDVEAYIKALEPTVDTTNVIPLPKKPKKVA